MTKRFTDLYEKKVDVVQRKKQARRMAKLAKSPSFQLKKKRALLKFRSADKIDAVARKKTIQQFRDKFFPQYDEMSLQQRSIVDQKLLQKFGPKIDKISKKMAMRLRKDEVERVKQARAAQREEDS
jgi:hypothetical protein